MFRETRARSVLKTVSWRFWATVSTMALVFLFTGHVKIALAIGGLEVVLKMLLYFLHERTWDLVKFGKKEMEPFVLWFTGLPASGKSTLADRVADHLRKKGLKVERLDGDQVRHDAYMIAIGGFSPLKGFISREDYKSIVEKRRLRSGLLFTIPVVLPVDRPIYDKAKRAEQAILLNPAGERIGVLHISGKFRRDLEKEAKNVYGTTEESHPGVKKIIEEGEFALAGQIRIAREKIDTGFPRYFLTPKETRTYGERQGWKRFVAFQTRNPMHRGHEYLTKAALEMSDGLMIHPIVGEVKEDDIPAPVRMECYEILLRYYYNMERVLLNVLPMAMRYAGPREALHHAIVRQNYGCTHIIIGRDHAGVGNFYGPYDAQKVFGELDKGDLRISPILFDDAFYCTRCKQMVTQKSCPHDPSSRISFSGTKVREMLRNGENLPEEFTRAEVAEVLRKWVSDNANR